MNANVLVTGYTRFVTDDFLANAFPGCRVFVTGDTPAEPSHKNKISVLRQALTPEALHTAFAVYDFDQVVFFSGGLEPFAQLSGDELPELASVLDECQTQTRFLYCMGPVHPEGFSVSVLEGAVMTLCRKSAMHMDHVNVIQAPWVYSLSAEQPPLDHLLIPGTHDMPFPADQELSFLSSEDLAVLLSRVFENWEYATEPYLVPNTFVCTSAALAAMIMETDSEHEYTFHYARGPLYPVQSRTVSDLRTRFMWFPVYSLLEDIPLLRRKKPTAHSWKDKLQEHLTTRIGRILLTAAELLTGALIMEWFMKLTNISVQFRMIDFRLVYIVIFGTMYNVRVGLLAALIASVSLVLAYAQQGTGWMNLFYEPTNWLPFVFYAMVGAACGYVRMRDTYMLEVSRGETRSITERYQYITRVNEDILQEKREYKQQIIGTRDSFGKIFQIVQQLNESHPHLLFTKALQVLETVMSSSGVVIISTADRAHYGRLVIASAGLDIPRSLKMEPYYHRLDTVQDGNVWVNRDLEKDMPDYMYAIRQNNTIRLVIMLKNADYSQLTLYYENLFRVICGLISNAMINAFQYQEAMRLKMCIDPASSVLSDEYFVQELQIAQDTFQQTKAPFILLEADIDNLSAAEFEERTSAYIRTQDILGRYHGRYYMLLYQAEPSDYPAICGRFLAHDLPTLLVPPERQRAMTSGEDGT